MNRGGVTDRVVVMMRRVAVGRTAAGSDQAVGPRKVDPVLAVGIWVGFGPEFRKKQSDNKQKADFSCIL